MTWRSGRPGVKANIDPIGATISTKRERREGQKGGPQGAHPCLLEVLTLRRVEARISAHVRTQPRRGQAMRKQRAPSARQCKARQTPEGGARWLCGRVRHGRVSDPQTEGNPKGERAQGGRKC